MSAIDQEIVATNTKEIAKQLVEGCIWNIENPIPGRTDGWARFHDGHPNYCDLSTGQVAVFLYDVGWNSDMSDSCHDVWEVSATLGVKISCQNWAGEKAYFEKLWQRIRRGLSRDSYLWNLPDITTTDAEGNNRITEKATYARIGMNDAILLGGNTALQIDGGKILQYQGRLQFKAYFSRGTRQ